MRYLVSILLLTVVLHAQSFTASASSGTPGELRLDEPGPNEPRPHQFWTFENRVNVSILAGLVAADGITTQRGISDGLREANPIMRPFATRGAWGEAAGSALGFGVAVGAVYLLHQTQHFKAERIVMRVMVAGESGFVVNNIVVLR